MFPLSPRPRPAFTLIELLTVIGIIAVLTVLTFPAIRFATQKAQETKCLANLRLLGIGITGYTGDHDGTLPGPLWVTQNGTYNVGNTGALGTLLWSYMGLPAPTNKDQELSVLVCPALRKRGLAANLSAYTLPEVKQVPGYRAFGQSGTTKLPVKLVWLTDPGQTVALVDRMITPPPHGQMRNALFFDMHVGPVADDWAP